MKDVFEYLFYEVTKEVFLDEYFDKKPLYIKGKPNKFNDIFCLNDFNYILNNNQLLYPKVRITDHHNSIHKYDLIEDKNRYENNLNNLLDKNKMLLALNKGGTLVFDTIQQHSSKLEDFIDQLSYEINTKINVNGYYTKKNTVGVNIHFDRHDVLVLQIHGSKRWYFKEDKHQLSKSMRHQKVPNVDTHRTGWESVLLEQGDIFYCPRGLWHFTETENQSSAHLAVGIYPVTLKRWLEETLSDQQISELLERYVKHPFDCTSVTHKDPIICLFETLKTKLDNEFNTPTTRRAYLELE